MRPRGAGRLRGRLALPLVAALLALFSAGCLTAPQRVHHLHPSPSGDGPRVLCVVAHPDDEIAFGGTLYKTATLLQGACDVLVITNGEGGFKYSTLAEPVYGLELSDEGVGREHLPAIRERELLLGCELLGVRDVYWLGEKDHRYTQDPLEVLRPDGPWDLDRVRGVLGDLLERNAYYFVLTLAPTEETHAHHKAATILALEAAAGLPTERRPAVLCVLSADEDDPDPRARELAGFPVTAVRDGPHVFDRRQAFGFRHSLDYRIVVNWAIAEHKSQGTMQLLMNSGDREHYFVFDVSSPDAGERAERFFSALAAHQYPARTYGESAGTNAKPR